VEQFAAKFDYFLFDCDGVLWYGAKQIGQAFRNIEYLESLGKKCYFVTNSSLISRNDLAAKISNDEFRYKNVKLDHLYPSATLAALYVKQNIPDCIKVNCIGSKGMKDEMRQHGFHLIQDFPTPEITTEQIDSYQVDPEVKAVVQGMDVQITYAKLAIASVYIQKGAKWVTTNEDPHGVSATGLRVPGNGQYVAQLAEGLKDPSGKGLICDKVCAGKPNPGIVDIIRKHHNIPESDLPKMVMIGDNCQTDIALGNNAGIASCLVLTGVVQDKEEAYMWAARDPSYKPTYILRSFGDKIQAPKM
jgi:4-nitrophenyl phosphatase